MTPLPASAPRAARPWRILVGASFAAGLAALALLLAEGRALGVGLMAVALVASAIGVRTIRLPAPLLSLLPLVAVVNAASIGWDWYTAWDPFDGWAHALNPVALVAPSMVWFHRARIVPARPGGPAFLAAATIYGLVLAVGWEVVETWFWTFPLADTASDVGLGVLGSLAGGWLAGRVVGPSRAR